MERWMTIVMEISDDRIHDLKAIPSCSNITTVHDISLYHILSHYKVNFAYV